MLNRDLKILRKRFGSDSVDNWQLYELQFDPCVYQRILFKEDITKKQAHKRLAWLWDNIRCEGYIAGNRKNIAVIAYPLTKDSRNWELFADVSVQIATVAVKRGDQLQGTFDNLDRAITCFQRNPDACVLPWHMLELHDGFNDRFGLFLSKAEVLSLGKSPQKPDLMQRDQITVGGVQRKTNKSFILVPRNRPNQGDDSRH
jgi:hypothetical protein